MLDINGVDIKTIAESYGTPTYVYDKKKITENYKTLSHAFTKYYPNTDIHFSVKSNSNLNILKVFKELGAGLDCSSPFEVLLAEKAGFAKEEIIYTGNYESYDDLSIISNKVGKINLDDIETLNRLNKVWKPEIISFRINPGIGRGGFEGITTAGADAKFGVPYEKSIDAYKAAMDAGYTRFGIHMMTGSNNLEPYYFAEALDKLMMIAGRTFNTLGIQPEYIDIGGGFGVPYEDDEEALNMDLTAQLISEVLSEKLDKYNFKDVKLVLEPGRFLIANAGYLVSRVISIKKSYKTFIGIDAGMNTLLRPALYGAHHRLEVYGKETKDNNVNICGQICENSDIFLKNVFLPEIKESDLVILKDAGAYGYVMSSNYNNRPRSAEVLVEDGQHKLIRKRETFEDILNLY